jgi:uncharacterized protein (DUF924 family)
MSVDEMHDRAEDVLAFWFGKGLKTAGDLKVASARWFANDPEFDAALGERFGTDVARAAEGRLDEWATSPRRWLALLILLDQFPRNIFRGTARAFQADRKARSVALAGIQRGDDARLSPVERVFAYLPLEHAEDLATQERSVALFTSLRDEAPAEVADMFDMFLDYAVKHRDVIARFGRFPHRNTILGRVSTDEERAYLETPGSGF